MPHQQLLKPKLMGVKVFTNLFLMCSIIGSMVIPINIFNITHENNALLDHNIKIITEFDSYSTQFSDLKNTYGEQNIFIQRDGKTVIAESLQENIINLNSKLSIELQKSIYELKKGGNGKFSTLNTPVRLILMFQDTSSPADRIGIIKNLNWEQYIEKSYDIIPAVLLNIPMNEISDSQNQIESTGAIYKIFTNLVRNIDDSYSIGEIKTIEDNNPSSSSLNTNNWWLPAIGADQVDYNGTGVNIAILDTGISTQHVDLYSRTPEVINVNFAHEGATVDPLDVFDTNGHGTHVAGIAAGKGISSAGKYIGVAPYANLFNYKVANTSGSILTSDVIDAVEYATTHDIDILSMSFGGGYAEVYNPETAALTEAVKKGIVAIASAGNSGPQFFTGGSPAAGVSVISVGATNQYNNVTEFSSLGPSYSALTIPDVLAPGEDIIAAEQRNSLISNYLRYTSSYISGSYANSHYIPLSGTSMSCPIVSGAVALLLQAFPWLTPEGVRIALYKGAYPPNNIADNSLRGDNKYGAGIINISASINWLKSLSDPYSIVSSYPDLLPIAPFDMLKYPGDEQYTNITLLSSKNNTKSIDIELPTISGLEITTDKSNIMFSNHSADFINVRIKILENATSGLKTGYINLNDSSTHELLDKIFIKIDVEYPKGRILFDSFHGLNDIYPGWPTGFMQMDIYNAMKSLHENGYKIDYKMDNWTYGYNSLTDSELLTAEKLSLVDIVVLQTPVLPYSEIEIGALKSFIDDGGSILILGTKYQSMARLSINSLLNVLGTGISIDSNNIFNISDVGLGYLLEDHSVTDVNDSSSIFSTGDEFTFWFGPTLSLAGPAYSLAELYNYPIVGAYEGQVLGRGNVVVWSDYHWLRNDIYDESAYENNPNAASHRSILINLFEFLNTRDDKEVIISANFNVMRTSEDTIEMDLSVLNSIDGSPNSTLIPGTSINATIQSPVGLSTELALTSLGNGIYSNLSVPLALSDYRSYLIVINISTPSGLVQRSYSIFKISLINQITLTDPTIEASEINRIAETDNRLLYDGSSALLDVDLYGSLTPTNVFNSKASQTYQFPLDYSIILSGYTNNFNVTGNENSGAFVFYAMGNNTNSYYNFGAIRAWFIIANHAPVIDEEASYFNTKTFNSTNTDDSYYIQQVDNLNPIGLTLITSESVEYEDETSELNAVVTYLSAAAASNTITFMFPNEIPFSKFLYSASNEIFYVDYYVPAELEFSGAFGDQNVSQQSVITSSYDILYLSLIFITVRDSEGASSDYLILLYVDITIPTNPGDYLPIVIVVVAIIGIVLFLYIRSSKNKNRPSSNDYYYSGYRDPKHPSTQNNIYEDPQNQTNEAGFINCQYCGKQIRGDTKFCPYCGAIQSDKF